MQRTFWLPSNTLSGVAILMCLYFRIICSIFLDHFLTIAENWFLYLALLNFEFLFAFLGLQTPPQSPRRSKAATSSRPHFKATFWRLLLTSITAGKCLRGHFSGDAWACQSNGQVKKEAKSFVPSFLLILLQFPANKSLYPSLLSRPMSVKQQPIPLTMKELESTLPSMVNFFLKLIALWLNQFLFYRQLKS